VKKGVLPYFFAGSAYALLVSGLYFRIVRQTAVPGSPDSVVPMALGRALDALRTATGHYPLWQPWTFSGMPTVEAFSYLSGLYLPNELLGFLHVDGLHLQLLHLLFAGTGGFALMKQLRLNDTAAFFTGAAFMLNPFMTAMLAYGHGSQLMTAAYMPWVLCATLRFCDRGSLTDAGILALLLGLQLQRAHVQIAYYTWLLMFPLAVQQFWLSAAAGRPYSKKLLLFVAVMVLGVAISLQIYWPSLEYVAYSARSGGTANLSAYDYATMWSMHPVELLTFLLPGSFGFGNITYWGFMPFTDFPQYAGIVVLVSAAAGFLSCRNDPLARFFAVTALLALVLAFGRHFSPLYDLFYRFAPLFSRFRVPSMALVISVLNLSVLGGYGVQALMERKPRPVLLQRVLIGIAAAVILFLVFEGGIEGFLRSFFPEPSVAGSDAAFLVDRTRWALWKGSFFTLSALGAAAAGVLWLAGRGTISARIAGAVLTLLSAADLLWIDLQIVYPAQTSLRPSPLVERKVLERAFQEDGITRFLSGRKGLFRIYPAGSLFPENKFSMFGIESAGGYHPAKLKIYQDLLSGTDNLANLNVLRMLNVAYVLSPSPVGHPELVPAGNGVLQLASGPVPVTVYQVTGSMPRVWFAPAVTSVGGDDEAVAAVMQSRQTDEVFAAGASWEGRKTFAGGTLLALRHEPESVTMRVRADGNAFLVLSEVYYPLRWKLTVDGRNQETVRVNGIIRGVELSAGTHDIRFVYDRSRFENGRRVSLAALCLAAAMVAAGLLLRKRKAAAKHSQS
jgi:hypothetical protein